MQYSIRIVWQGFGKKEATEVACVRSCQRLLPCLTDTIPAGPETGQGRDSDGASGVTYLRSGGGGNCPTAAAGERNEDM